MAHPSSRPLGAGVFATLALLLASCGPVVDLGADDTLDFVRQPRTSQVLAPDGTVLADLHGEQDRTELALEEMGGHLPAAVVAIEDRRFFQHAGIDGRGLARAAARNVEAGEVTEGGSTLTQQYVKNTMTGPSRTFERKAEEAVLAWRLERTHDKASILEHYLNTVYLGRGAYGVGAASERFFDRAPDELTLDEAALLAGLIASPARLDPEEHPDRAVRRRALVLEAMVEEGVVDASQAAQAADAPVELAPADDAPTQDAAWFLAEVRRTLLNDPADRFTSLGATLEERADAVYAGGLRIETTVDLEVQRAAEQAVEDLVPDGPSAAVVLLDAETAAVRALVGGRADADSMGFNLATQGRRQAGSAFKPLALATALERGTPLEQVYPGGSCVSFEEVPGWEDGVCNYQETTYGPLSLREATIRSINTTYARLGVDLGAEAMIAMATALGIRSELPRVPALALGAGEVTPLELAGAYQVFAASGQRADPYLVSRVTTDDGEVLYEHEAESRLAMQPEVAAQVTDALEDVVARGTGERADIGRPQAGKTGTSQQHADAWFVGYTPDVVGAVWIGFPEGRIPLEPPAVDEAIEGGRLPADLWAEIVGGALAGVSPRDFDRPEIDFVEVEVDTQRECLPHPNTPDEATEVRRYVRGTQPTELCTQASTTTGSLVPDVVGRTVEDAATQLTEAGIAHEVRRQHSDRYPPGVVLRQRPSAGSVLAEGDRLVLWRSVSSRTRQEVPEVVGRDLEDAVARLEREGFVVEERRACPCDEPAGVVHTQRPAGGEVLPEHDVVTVLVPPTADDGPAGR